MTHLISPHFFGRGICTLIILLLIGCSNPAPPRLPDDGLYPFDSRDFASHVDPPRIESYEPAVPLKIDPPDGVLSLSIEQAIVSALHSNRDLRVQLMNPIIDGALARIERGEFDPELFAEYTYSEEESIETSRSTGAQFGVIADDSESALGLRQQLPTGTSLELAVSQAGSESNRTPEQQTARAGISLTQSLLRGFGPAVNLVRVRQAEFDALASRQELKGFVENLLAETEIAYWNYILATEEIRIFQESLEIARKQLEEVQLRIEVGILPEIDQAAARAEEALRVQNLIDAHSQIEDRRLRLLRLVSPGGENHFDRLIAATSPFRLSPSALQDLEERLQLAQQSRPDLQEALLRLEQNRLETIATRNGLLPKLDVFINYGTTGYADSFSESFRQLNQETYDLSAGIRFSHFLGNRANRARNLAAFAARQQAAEAVANLKQLIHLDVRLTFNEVERARKQIDASSVTRQYQEQTLNAEKERFNVGSSTALQVAQAQRDYLRAQIAEVEAIVSYRTALVRLYLAEGSLLDRRGISIGY